MLSIEPSGAILGATIHGIDTADTTPLSLADVGTVLDAIGRWGVLRFPGNVRLTPVQQLAFARNFGETQTVKRGHIPDHPEMSVLSNIFENGKPIGARDAGIIFHRDMTYRDPPGFCNLLHAIKVPYRDGSPLGPTKFTDSQAAYDDLPDDIKARLEGLKGVNTAKRYVEIIKSQFPPEISKIHEGYHSRQDFALPLVLTHPITRRKLLYADYGHLERIEGGGLGERGAGELLETLNKHQLQEKYQYTQAWAEGDIMMWDNMRTLHCATLDFRPDEYRHMERCQILSDKIRDPAFMAKALAAAGLPPEAQKGRDP